MSSVMLRCRLHADLVFKVSGCPPPSRCFPPIRGIYRAAVPLSEFAGAAYGGRATESSGVGLTVTEMGSLCAVFRLQMLPVQI